MTRSTHPHIKATEKSPKLSYAKLQSVSWNIFWEEMKQRIPEADQTTLMNSTLADQLLVSRVNHSVTMLTDVLFMGSRSAGALVDDSTVGGMIMSSMHENLIGKYPGKGVQIGTAIDAAVSRISADNVMKEIASLAKSRELI
jgi:hypothetical protein